MEWHQINAELERPIQIDGRHIWYINIITNPVYAVNYVITILRDKETGTEIEKTPSYAYEHGNHIAKELLRCCEQLEEDREYVPLKDALSFFTWCVLYTL